MKGFSHRIKCISAACLVALVITAAYKNAILDDPDVDHLEHVDFMWRLLIGLGCVPGVIALYFRLTIPETPRFTMDIERNVFQAADDIKNVLTTGKFNVDPDAVVQRAEAPRASLQDFRAHFGRWDNMKVLIGTSYSWFALDVSTHIFLCLSSPAHFLSLLDCVLRTWIQLVHHSPRHWFRQCLNHRYPSHLRESL